MSKRIETDKVEERVEQRVETEKVEEGPDVEAHRLETERSRLESEERSRFESDGRVET